MPGIQSPYVFSKALQNTEFLLNQRSNAGGPMRTTCPSERDRRPLVLGRWLPRSWIERARLYFPLGLLPFPPGLRLEH